MLTTLLFTAALAADPAGLVPTLAALPQPLVVGVTDAELAQRFRALDVADERITLAVVVLPPGAIASVELGRAMSEHGATCALEVTANPIGFGTTSHGVCSPSASPPAPTTATAATPPAPPAPSVPAPAPAEVVPVPSLAEELAALPSHAARRALLQERLASLTDPDDLVEASSALAVVNALDQAGRTDRSVVKLFLRAATSPDAAVRAQALEAARTDGDPPAVEAVPVAPSATPAPPAPTVAAAPSADALDKYRNQRLVRDKLQYSVVSSSYVPATQYSYGMATTQVRNVVTWTVYDGGGAPFTAESFARRVGDSKTVSLLKEERERAQRAKGPLIALGSVGAAATLYSFTLLMKDDSNAGAAAAGLTASSAVAGTAFAVAFTWPAAVRTRQQFVARYYTTAQADERIRAYNDKLRADLGLAPEDVTSASGASGR